MRFTEKRRLESALRERFRSERPSAGARAGHAGAVAALAAAEAARASGSGFGPGDLARAAVRFSPRAFWAAPAAVAALALALALSGAPAREAQAALVASGPVLVAACLAGVVRARSCLMQELEASCPRNAVSVACARLAVLGGATLLALAFACAVCSAAVPAGAAVAWSAGVGALCLLLGIAAPGAYCAGAVWAWAAVSAAGALWLAREAAGWLRLCAQGGVASESARRARAF